MASHPISDLFIAFPRSALPHLAQAALSGPLVEYCAIRRGIA